MPAYILSRERNGQSATKPCAGDCSFFAAAGRAIALMVQFDGIAAGDLNRRALSGAISVAAARGNGIEAR